MVFGFAVLVLRGVILTGPTPVLSPRVKSRIDLKIIFEYECVHEIFRDVLWFLVLFSKSVFRLCSMTRLILSDLCPVYVRLSQCPLMSINGF